MRTAWALPTETVQSFILLKEKPLSLFHLSSRLLIDFPNEGSLLLHLSFNIHSIQQLAGLGIQ